MKRGRPPKNTETSLKDYFASGENKARWEKAKAAAAARGGFGEYDDGKYRVQVVSAKVNHSESSGRLQHVLGFKFLDGDYKGKKVYQYQGLENDTGLEILIATLKRLGYETEHGGDVDDADKALEKEQPEVMIRIKTNGEYQNIIVLNRLEEKEESEEEDESDDNEADESKESAKEPEDSDDDDDDDGEKGTSEESEEDDEDEEEDEEEEKPKTKPEPSDDDDEDEDEDEDDEDQEEKPEVEKEEVTLAVKQKVKVQFPKEVIVAKIVKIDEENSRVKIKKKDGMKEWVPANKIIDVVE